MKRDKKEIPIYKISFSMDVVKYDTCSIITSFTKVHLKHIIRDVKHKSLCDGESTMFYFHPLYQKLKWYRMEITRHPMHINSVDYENVFSKENTQQAFVERIKKTFLPTFPIRQYVDFVTTNKEDFLSALKQLPIIIETIFKNKVILGKEPKEHYYKDFINPIIEHISHDN